jgi:hypothetical protein
LFPRCPRYDIPIVERIKEQLVASTKTWGLVVIGAGVRCDPDYMFLFEKAINLVHDFAPGVHICFNTYPTDTKQAVDRWTNAKWHLKDDFVDVKTKGMQTRILLMGLDL